MITVLGEGERERIECGNDTRICQGTFACDPTIHCDGCSIQISFCICTDLSGCGGGCSAQISLCNQCSRLASLCNACSQLVSRCGNCSQLISECKPCTGVVSECFAGSRFDFTCVAGSEIQFTDRITQVIQRGQIQSIEEIAVLREDLQKTLEQLDEFEQNFDGAGSLAEAEEMEQRLEAALKEVQERKKQLQKG
jgi:ElaB/YqjD/DUF883 family membrane-anchored ribosome-binding protein